jgi:hypothetical protein
MKIIIKLIFVFLAGTLLGMVVNMGLIVTGYRLIPFADGMNPMNATLWEIKYFIFPFLARAIGTLAGAFFVAKFASKYQMVFAYSIGVFFLLGGISMVFIMPAPVWFIVADLSLAYLPMGWLGWKLSGQINHK